MKEIHAYRNEDGTYKLEIIADYIKNGELMEAHIIYESIEIKSNDFMLSPSGEIFTFVMNKENNYDKQL